jgi:uncharacterized OsmC-like protein
LALEDEYSYATWTAEWKGGLVADVSGRGHAIRADEPPEFGGTDTGPMPTELLAAALASCFCLALAWAARKRRVALQELEVAVRPRRARGEPRHGTYDVRVHANVPRETLEPLVRLAERYCWVTNTLKTPPEIRYYLDGDEPGRE